MRSHPEEVANAGRSDPTKTPAVTLPGSAQVGTSTTGINDGTIGDAGAEPERQNRN